MTDTPVTARKLSARESLPQSWIVRIDRLSGAILGFMFGGLAFSLPNAPWFVYPLIFSAVCAMLWRIHPDD